LVPGLFHGWTRNENAGIEMKGPSEDTGGPWEMEVIRGDSGGKQGSGDRYRETQKNPGEIRAIHGRSRENTGRFEEDTRQIWGDLEESDRASTGRTYELEILGNTRSIQRDPGRHKEVQGRYGEIRGRRYRSFGEL
jgi:hypothetical protein